MTIAYSAIDGGDLVFGNSAILALDQDADELGQIVASNGVANYLKDDSFNDK